jgi:hypothetical protein
MFSFSSPSSSHSLIRQKLISRILILVALITTATLVKAQFNLDRVIISELSSSGEIELFNPSTTPVDISEYWVCNFPDYTRVSNLTLISGSLQLAPGATVVVSNFPGFNSTDGELGLYATNTFGSSAAIRSYIEYGSSGNSRSGVAIAAGIWTAGMALPSPTPNASIQAQGTPPSTLTYTNISPTIGTPDPSLLNTINVDGGAISLVSGATDTVTCIDGVPSPFNVLRDGNAQGTNRGFVITDDLGNILALPPNNGPFDLEGAGIGTCEIWYLAYENGLQNLATGNNLSDLMGTFDLSNPIRVYRQAPDGGTITLVGGATDTIVTAGNAIVNVEHTTTATALSYWYIITDQNDDILAFANSANTSTLDLSGAPAGTCRIWGWSYRGLDDPKLGDDIVTLNDDACENISNNFITVVRQGVNVDGGAISLVSGATDTVTCIDGVPSPFNVLRDGNAQGTNRGFVITDDLGNILALPPNNGPFDLEGAGIGTCEIWYLAYENGLQNLATGNNLSDLMGTFDLSNPIRVYRQAPDGGTITLVGGATDTIVTAGNAIVNVEHTTTATALSYWYIITDDNDNILAFANSANTSTLDLSGAPAGTCHIWGWSYRGLDDPIVGDNISTLTDDACEAISTNFINVVRQGAAVDGGAISLVSGATDTVTCIDGVPSPFNVLRDGNAQGTNRGFVITDDLGNILALPPNNGPFDLEGAGIGTCEIWYLAYENGLQNLATGNNLSDLMGTFDLSNPIRVYRQAPDGGTVTLAGGGTNFIGCAGDISFDVEHTTTATALSYWYIITDDNNEILGFANSANTSTLDLSGATAGTCRVWGWSYRGLDDPIVGDNISTLTDDACEAISDDFITVYREVPDGGTVTLVGGATDTIVTAGNAIVNVEHTTTGGFLSYWYIVTDDNDNILAFANSANTSTLDLSGAPAGTCHIWGWNYRGLDDPIVGDNISTLNDDFCEDISDTFINVVRENPNTGGNQDMTIALNEVGVNGWIEIINNTDQTVDISSYWVCNRPSYAILSSLNVECGSMNLAPGDIVVVSGFSGLDVVDGELALFNSNSFGSSTAIVSYMEWGSSGHGRSSVAIDAGLWTVGRELPAPTASSSLQRDIELVNGESAFTLADQTFCEVNSGVSSTRGLEELQGVSVYPNPASDFIQVSIEGVDSQEKVIRLFNTVGQLIENRPVSGLSSTSQIDISLLPSGTYSLQVVSGNAATTRRIVKQ